MLGSGSASPQEEIMRSLGLISSIAVASLFAIVSCALQPADEAANTPSQSQEVSAAKPDELAAPVTTDDAEALFGDAIVPRTGCSQVKFCNAPGSDGAQCTQQGCTTGQAE